MAGLDRASERVLGRALEAGVAAEACLADPQLRAQLAPTATDRELQRLVRDGQDAAGTFVAANEGLVQWHTRRYGPPTVDRLQAVRLAALERTYSYDAEQGPYGSYVYDVLRFAAQRGTEESVFGTNRGRENALRALRSADAVDGPLPDLAEQGISRYRAAAALRSSSATSLDIAAADTELNELQVVDPGAERALDSILGSRTSDLLALLTPQEYAAVADRFDLDGSHLAPPANTEAALDREALVICAIDKMRRAAEPAEAHPSLAQCAAASQGRQPRPEERELPRPAAGDLAPAMLF